MFYPCSIIKWQLLKWIITPQTIKAGKLHDEQEMIENSIIHNFISLNACYSVASNSVISL